MNTIQLRLPDWSLNALINGDSEGLTKREEDDLSSFRAKYPGITVPCPDNDSEPSFYATNDINRLGSNCYELDCLI